MRHIIILRLETDDHGEEYTLTELDEAVRAHLRHVPMPNKGLLIDPTIIDTSSAII